MGRRPEDIAQQNPSMGHGQQAVWTKVRELKCFGVEDLWLSVDMERRSIAQYLERLEAGGIIKCTNSDETGQGAFVTNKYELIKDVGLTAPRFTPKGNKVSAGQKKHNMWRSMRMMKIFSTKDLALHSSNDELTVSSKAAATYVGYLLRAEYLRVFKKRGVDQPNNLYRLIKDTGPKYPMVQRSTAQLFDQNLQKVTFIFEVAK